MFGKRIFHADLFGECSCCMILKAGWTWTLSPLSACFQDHIKAVFKCCLNWTQCRTRLVGKGCHLAVMYIDVYHCATIAIHQISSWSQSLIDVWGTKLPLIWTFHRCFLKVLHTYKCLRQWWLFPKVKVQSVTFSSLTYSYMCWHTVLNSVLSNSKTNIFQFQYFLWPNIIGFWWLVGVGGITSDPEKGIVTIQ